VTIPTATPVVIEMDSNLKVLRSFFDVDEIELRKRLEA